MWHLARLLHYKLYITQQILKSFSYATIHHDLCWQDREAAQLKLAWGGSSSQLEAVSPTYNICVLIGKEQFSRGAVKQRAVGQEKMQTLFLVETFC